MSLFFTSVVFALLYYYVILFQMRVVPEAEAFWSQNHFYKDEQKRTPWRCLWRALRNKDTQYKIDLPFSDIRRDVCELALKDLLYFCSERSLPNINSPRWRPVGTLDEETAKSFAGNTLAAVRTRRRNCYLIIGIGLYKEEEGMNMYVFFLCI